MPHTADLARRLVDYDERLARDVLELVCARLGGPAEEGGADVETMRSFLANADVARSQPLSRLGDVGDAPSTTSEWKTEFSHVERMRTLGLALSDLLGADRV